MWRARNFFLLMTVVAVVMLLRVPAEAFWGFGSDQEKGTSGLDLIKGYDRNTVTKVTGRVAVAPDQKADPVTVEILVGSERVVAVLGPRWYLQDDNLELKAGDTVTVRGSMAQGKDGRTYLLAQWMDTPDGGQLVLRSTTGRPGWSGGAAGNQQGVTMPQRGGTAGGRRGR